MSELIQNRFTQSKFDNARSASVADGTKLTARYTCTGRLWRASLAWKKGWERAQDSITAYDEQSLKNAILKLDPTARFIGQVNPNVVPVESLADKQAEMLEMLRTDPNTSQKAYESACKMYKEKPKPRNAPAEVRAQNGGRELSVTDAKVLEALRVDVARTSDVAYRNACAKFGVQPQPRPTQAVTPASQSLVPFHVQGTAYGAFMQAHGELFTSIFAEQNASVIAQWMQDENRQIDATSLDQCYRELKAANCFRTAATLTRGMNGAPQIFQPYSHARIVALRNQQAVEVATAPPDYLSDVEKDCWNAVRQAYPQLPVGSPAFQDCCKRTLLKWCQEFVLENQPELAAANKKGELSVAVTKVLNSWAKISHPNRKVDDKGKTLIWLG
jgi:hypothetical protein